MKLNLGKPLCFFDLETTGLQITTARIVEICILKVHPDERVETLTRRINPLIPIPAEVSKIHGIYDCDVALEPSFKEVASELQKFIGNADLAGYNSNKFDVPVLVEEFLRVGIEFDFKNRRCVDVQNIFHKMEARTLAAASKFYLGKPLENAHSALADTMATYEILKAQIERYENEAYEDKEGNITVGVVKNDVEALAEFSKAHRWADLAGHIIYGEGDVELFNFGKHKGLSVANVFAKDKGYYEWILKSEFPESTKKVLTEIQLRKAKMQA